MPVTSGTDLLSKYKYYNRANQVLFVKNKYGILPVFTTNNIETKSFKILECVMCHMSNKYVFMAVLESDGEKMIYWSDSYRASDMIKYLTKRFIELKLENITLRSDFKDEVEDIVRINGMLTEFVKDRSFLIFGLNRIFVELMEQTIGHNNELISFPIAEQPKKLEVIQKEPEQSDEDFFASFYK